MKTTIYELLGMIKDGKAPKKIKWNDLIYEKSKYNATPRGYYYRINGGIKLWFLDEINSLNDEVEILEEEKKIPKIIPECLFVEYTESAKVYQLYKTLREIIDYLDYLKSKGE